MQIDLGSKRLLTDSLPPVTQGENGADSDTILLPRYYNARDLADCTCVLRGTNIEYDAVAEQVLDKAVQADALELRWRVTADYTAYPGAVRLELRVLGDEGLILKLAGNRPMTVRESPDRSDILPPTVAEQVLNGAQMAAAQAAEQAKAAQEASGTAAARANEARTAADEAAAARDAAQAIRDSTAVEYHILPDRVGFRRANEAEFVYTDSLTGRKGDKGDPGRDGSSFRVLGLCPAPDDLTAAHPTGNDGDAYAVGTAESNTVYLWDADAAQWRDVGPLTGPPGKDGKDGAPGSDGRDGSPGAVGSQGPPGTDGKDGAVGPPGKDGAQGPAGQDGKSAYQTAVDAGYTGTEAELAARLADLPSMAGGTYTGDGQEERAIALGFRPRFGMVFSVTAYLIESYNPQRISYHGMGFVSPAGCSLGLSLTDSGITVLSLEEGVASPSTPVLNKAGVTYAYMMWR